MVRLHAEALGVTRSTARRHLIDRVALEDALDNPFFYAEHSEIDDAILLTAILAAALQRAQVWSDGNKRTTSLLVQRLVDPAGTRLGRGGYLLVGGEDVMDGLATGTHDAPDLAQMLRTVLRQGTTAA